MGVLMLAKVEVETSQATAKAFIKEATAIVNMIMIVSIVFSLLITGSSNSLII